MEPLPGFGLVIAIVDDEECVRKALERLFRSVGHTVATFRSGEDFLYALGICRPDCAILDFHLPGLTGLDVQRCLRRNRISLPCIIITGKDEPETRERVLAAGGAGYLTKPLDQRKLFDMISAAVPGAHQSVPDDAATFASA